MARGISQWQMATISYHCGEFEAVVDASRGRANDSHEWHWEWHWNQRLPQEGYSLRYAALILTPPPPPN
jgi:hypothetical protein